MMSLPKPHVMSKAFREIPDFSWGTYTDDLMSIMRMCCEVDPKGPNVEAVKKISQKLRENRPHWYNGVIHVEGDADFDRDFAHVMGRGFGINQQLLKFSTKGEPCSNPSCNNEAIRNSHTLQRERVLRSIANAEGDVIRLYPNSSHPHGIEAGKVSIKSASAFPGFCDVCETSLFASAESANKPPTRHYVLLLCWRALISVHYQKVREAILKAHAANALIKSDAATEELYMALSYLTHMKDSLRTCEDIRRKIRLLEGDIFRKRKNVSTHCIRMYDSPFVGAGVIPLGSKRKRKCPNAHDWSDRYDFGAYNMTSDGRDLYFVASLSKQTATEKAYDYLLKEGDEFTLRSSILTLLSGGGRNAYVSPEYWEICSPEMRMTIRQIANEEHTTPLSIFPTDPPFGVERMCHQEKRPR